ncbi:MAG: type II toxin-antitoxin system RelE/ParE family toxin [Plesiomonas sp.]
MILNMKETMFHGDSEKVLKSFPPKQLEQFATSLFYLASGKSSALRSKPMNGLGDGVMELLKNGHPAYRCVYVIRGDVLHVLHAFVKTSGGTDKKHETTIKQRFKQID